MEKGHGRLERRSIQTSTALNEYLDFPCVGQVFKITRTVVELKTSQSRQETVYGVSSLGPQQASAERLLEYNRGHWSIENRSHYVRDMSFDEDRLQIRKGNGPRVMATLRNFAISLLRLAGATNIAAALRACQRSSRLVMLLLGY
jgi:predicted transposase YbfD/YdcC